MKILMFSSDPRIAEKNSRAASRMASYGEAVDKLYVFLLIRENKESTDLSSRVSVRVFSGRFFRFWRGYKAANVLLSREKYDLITTQDMEHAFIASKLAKKYNLPFQMQIHTDIFSDHFRTESFVNKLRFKIAMSLIPKAASIRVVSERIRRLLLEKFPETQSKIVTLPIFEHVSSLKGNFDLRKKYPGFDFIILMVSRLSREKNVSLALKAMRQVLDEKPRVLLVIVGDGPLRQSLESEAANYGLSGNVKFEGWHENLDSYYSKSDAYLLTSDYEGYGMAVMEALSYGLPIIMTDVGVAGDVVKNGVNGIVIPTRDARALSDAILKLISEPYLREKIWENNRKIYPPYRSFEDYRGKIISSWKACLN